MKIFWNDLTIDQWDAFLKKAPKSNLLQTWPYAQMMRYTKQMNTRFGRVAEGDQTIAIFQIHEVTLTPLYHAFTLDRGPIWLIKDVTATHWEAFTETLNKELPKRFGRRRRFMPELTTVTSGQPIQNAGFSRQTDGYQSIWIDLQKDEPTLRAQLKQKWRNALNQSEKKGLLISEHSDNVTFEWLMQRYTEDRKLKKYRGPSVSSLKGLYKFCKPRGEVLILLAQSKQTSIAAILLFLHGRSATYQVGWTSEEGRELRAHQFLLWRAMTKLKAEGFSSIDLGGIEPKHASGVTQFKRGIGGEEFQLAGVYN